MAGARTFNVMVFYDVRGTAGFSVPLPFTFSEPARFRQSGSGVHASAEVGPMRGKFGMSRSSNAGLRVGAMPGHLGSLRWINSVQEFCLRPRDPEVSQCR